jgi:hypothetical protein
MFPSRRRMLILALAALLGLAANTLAACGDGGSDEGNLLTPATASRLQSTLDDIEQTARRGDCETAGARADAFAQEVEALRGDVDSGLRRALVSGADRLQSLVSERCQPAVTTTPPAEQPPAETAPEEDQEQQGKDKEKPTKEPKDEDEGEEDQGGQGDDQAGGDEGGVQPGSGEDTGGVTP